MIRIIEKQEFKEAEDQKLQKIVYELFKYLCERDIPKNLLADPDYETKIIKAYQTNRVEHIVNGLFESFASLEDYFRGYQRSIAQYEKETKKDYSSKKLMDVLLVLRKAEQELIKLGGYRKVK